MNIIVSAKAAQKVTSYLKYSKLPATKVLKLRGMGDIDAIERELQWAAEIWPTWLLNSFEKTI